MKNEKKPETGEIDLDALKNHLDVEPDADLLRDFANYTPPEKPAKSQGEDNK